MLLFTQTKKFSLHFSSLDRVLLSQSLVGSFQIYFTIGNSLANTDRHWKDADVEDTGAPDPGIVAVHSEQQLDIHLV